MLWCLNYLCGWPYPISVVGLQGLIRWRRDSTSLTLYIKPLSDLRNTNGGLKDIAVGDPVFLTKNGRGLYAIEYFLHVENNRNIVILKLIHIYDNEFLKMIGVFQYSRLI